MSILILRLKKLKISSANSFTSGRTDVEASLLAFATVRAYVENILQRQSDAQAQALNANASQTQQRHLHSRNFLMFRVCAIPIAILLSVFICDFECDAGCVFCRTTKLDNDTFSTGKLRMWFSVLACCFTLTIPLWATKNEDRHTLQNASVPLSASLNYLSASSSLIHFRLNVLLHGFELDIDKASDSEMKIMKIW